MKMNIQYAIQFLFIIFLFSAYPGQVIFRNPGLQEGHALKHPTAASNR